MLGNPLDTVYFGQNGLALCSCHYIALYCIQCWGSSACGEGQPWLPWLCDCDCVVAMVCTVMAVTVASVLCILSQHIDGAENLPKQSAPGCSQPSAGGWLGSYSPCTWWEGKKGFTAAS